MIVCLQETKVSVFSSQLVAETIGQRMDGYYYLPAIGTRGGILIGWQSDYVGAGQPSLKEFSLSVEITSKCTGSTFLLSTVYGPSEDENLSRFLDELVFIKPTRTLPWLVIDDFNMIYEARDKSNNNLNRWLMGQFRNTLDRCELFELSLQNWRFTWSNERHVPTLVRLDRAFCNKDWDVMFAGGMLQALSTSLSDHCPIFLCQQSKPRFRDTFRFENFWTKVPRFKEVVTEAWHAAVPGRPPLNVLYYKMVNTAKVLKSWSKKQFGNARIQLHMTNEIVHRLDVA
jgi:hypothetical protein